MLKEDSVFEIFAFYLPHRSVVSLESESVRG